MPVSILPAPTAPEGTAPAPLDGRRFASLESGDHVLTARECAEIVMVWMKEAAGIPSKVKVKRAPVETLPVPEQKPVIECVPNPSAQHAFRVVLERLAGKVPPKGFVSYDDAASTVIEALDVARRKEYAAGRKAGAEESSAELGRTLRNLEDSRAENAKLRAALAEATGDDGKKPDQKGALKPWRLLATERKVTADLRQELAAVRGSNLLAQHELTIRAYESVLARVANALGAVRPHVGGPERLRDAADEALRTADAWRHGPIVDIVREHPGGVVAAAMQCLTSALATHRALAEAKLPLAQGATRG